MAHACIPSPLDKGKDQKLKIILVYIMRLITVWNTNPPLKEKRLLYVTLSSCLYFPYDEIISVYHHAFKANTLQLSYIRS